MLLKREDCLSIADMFGVKMNKQRTKYLWKGWNYGCHEFKPFINDISLKLIVHKSTVRDVNKWKLYRIRKSNVYTGKSKQYNDRDPKIFKRVVSNNLGASFSTTVNNVLPIRYRGQWQNRLYGIVGFRFLGHAAINKFLILPTNA